MNILVADDELSIRSLVGELLEEEGHTVTLAEDGEDALKKFNLDWHEVVFSDIRMPNMTGIELLQEVKKINENTQFIIMTSHASVDNSIAALKKGAFDYIIKPFEDLDIVVETVNRAIANLSGIREQQYLLNTLSRQNAELGDLNKKFGDHLIPVLWTYPLPCWIGTLVSTMDLGGEAVINGKRLIRDTTQHLAFGYRNTRVEGLWTNASSAGFTLTYKLKIEQFVSRARDGGPLRDETTKWLFDVEGLATYSFRDQAWETITEKVHARPKELPDDRLCTLYDEVFAGTIKIRRVRETKGKKQRQP